MIDPFFPLSFVDVDETSMHPLSPHRLMVPSSINTGCTTKGVVFRSTRVRPFSKFVGQDRTWLIDVSPVGPGDIGIGTDCGCLNL